ncbi:hypothetical protein V1264_016305 [Littorina saxatilis]|uniref:Uncharacterized protein n=1 Tax=Littorina saxatilis TaxID=31220 RepID=A0AAN9BLQ0_9CAEN
MRSSASLVARFISEKPRAPLRCVSPSIWLTSVIPAIGQYPFTSPPLVTHLIMSESWLCGKYVATPSSANSGSPTSYHPLALPAPMELTFAVNSFISTFPPLFHLVCMCVCVCVCVCPHGYASLLFRSLSRTPPPPTHILFGLQTSKLPLFILLE